MYAVILAGGEGTRLWPLSRPDRPKPFLPLLGPSSLLQRTVARIAPLVQPADVYVVTDRRYAPLVREQLPDLPADNVIGEPLGRNTGPAIALAATTIDRPDDDAMVVLPADHQVLDEVAFRAALAAAAAAAADGSLVTLGIRPAGPETGYGYILARPPAVEPGGGTDSPGRGGRTDRPDDASGSADHVGGDTREAAAGPRALRPLEVERFVEKPDLAGAQALLATGLAAWNSGIFIWTRRTICNALTRYAPDVVGALQEALAERAGSPATDRSAALDAVYPALRARSIDYAVMEPASLQGDVRVIPIDVGWSDLGSWSALRDAWAAEDALRRGDESRVVGGGDVVGSGNRWDIESRDCLVVAGDRLVVTIGLADTIVVDTPDALLVCAADRSQDVRRVATELAARASDR